MQQLLLVNEYDVRQRFELRPDEAHALFYGQAIKFCLADTLNLSKKAQIENGIAFHVTIDDADSWAAAVNATIDMRRENGENDLPTYVETSATAKSNAVAEADDKLAAAFQIVAPDNRKGGANLN